MNWRRSDAALFDLDGVLEPPAEARRRTWRQRLTVSLGGRGVAEQGSAEAYFAYVDGEPSPATARRERVAVELDETTLDTVHRRVSVTG